MPHPIRRRRRRRRLEHGLDRQRRRVHRQRYHRLRLLGAGCLELEPGLVGAGGCRLHRIEQSQARARGSLLEPGLGQDPRRQLFFGRVPGHHGSGRLLHVDDLRFGGLQARYALDVPAGSPDLCAAPHSQGLNGRPSGISTAREFPRRLHLMCRANRSLRLINHDGQHIGSSPRNK